MLRKSSQSIRQFSWVRSSFYELLNMDDSESKHYLAATHDPNSPLPGHQSQIKTDYVDRKVQISKLQNGVTIVTEQPRYPGVVDLGILLKIGTRDETHESSGALLSIKNTYYKSLLKTNEAINYGMVQMSGGAYNMDYTREDAYFKAHCLSHDVVDIFNMMSDCVNEPRGVTTANVGIQKNKDTLHLDEKMNLGESFHDSIFSTAYGNHGLGMPLKGSHHNVENLTSHVLQSFQIQNMRPDKIICCASGVHIHEEFVELVKDNFDDIPPHVVKPVEREHSHYIGGEVRTLTEDNDLHIALAFEGARWTSEDAFVYQVISALLHNPYVNDHYFSAGRLHRNVLHKNSNVDKFIPINFHYSDTGLFGLQISGDASASKNLIDILVNQLKDLTKPISAQELATAKSTLKTNIAIALDRSADRLEELSRNIAYFNEVIYKSYFEKIDAVTSEKINSVIANMLSKSRPTIIAQGGEVNRLPSYDQIQNSLKLQKNKNKIITITIFLFILIEKKRKENNVIFIQN